MNKTFATRLLKSRFKPPQELRRVFEASKQVSVPSRRQAKYVKGVVKGNFVRVKIPGKQPPARLPKLPSPATTPVKSFTKPQGQPAGPTTTIQEFRHATNSERKEFFQEYWDRLKAWTKHNFAVIILNFGSVCSLIGFTRSDVLELRLLSVTGTFSYIVYFLALPPPRDWTPILWSLTFLAVNGQKIYEILVERKADLHTRFHTPEFEQIYETYFKSYGITLRQFQYIMEKAKTIELKKGDILLREGDRMTDVYLVTSGKTRASSLGRRMTAVSFKPQAHVEKGAWIGEMAYLSPESERRGGQTDRAMYTIVAQEDTIVRSWSHDDMKALMERSSDMRSALTRAMTAAIVEKVVGFTNSKRRATQQRYWGLERLWPWRHQESEQAEDDSQPPKVTLDKQPVFSVPEGGTNS